MAHTERNIRVDDDLWSSALSKATSEDRSVADVFRELVADWIRETPEDAEQRARNRELEAENARLRAEVSANKRSLENWLEKGRRLQAEITGLSTSLPE